MVFSFMTTTQTTQTTKAKSGTGALPDTRPKKTKLPDPEPGKSESESKSKSKPGLGLNILRDLPGWENCSGKDDFMLFHGNCLALMDNILEITKGQGIFDMIFADPPYFLSNGGVTCVAGKMVEVNKGDWDVSQGPDLNHEFNMAWLSRCQKLLKPDGTIWVSGTHHVIYSVGFALQQLGMKIINDITWEKPNPPPNLACKCFTHATETVIWAAKEIRSKYRFNYAEMKAENKGKQMKSVWTFTAPPPAEKVHGKHPTQKPLSLLSRCIKASTVEGDAVFDPFCGSGTTGIAALMNGRKFVGCEMAPEYVDLTLSRLNHLKACPPLNLRY